MKKKKIYYLLVAVMAVCLAICGVGATSIVAEAETAEELLPNDTVIVVAAGLDDDVLPSAITLQHYVQEVSGMKLDIVTDAEAKASFEICMGDTNRTETTIGDVPDGSYAIKSFDGGVELLGMGKRGMTYAVYEFMRRFGGCEWYASSLAIEGEYIVKPVDVDISYNTYFEYTDTDWVSPRDHDYSLAHGLNGGGYRTLSYTEGGTVNYLSGFCHTLSTQFCAASTYFATHPEYFALHDGERVGKQLCLTNPEVLEIVTEEVLELLEKSYDPDVPLQIVSLTQADNEDYCQCENCKKLDDANGAHSGTMITFVNQVAAAVKAHGYDNVAIDTFAYRYTRACPTAVVPLDNVIVRLCTIECCFSHALDDATCEENVELMKDLSNWGKICNRIYVWDYATNYSNTCGPFPDFGEIQRNMQVFYENNVKGVYEEGNYYMSYCNTEFGDLRSYLLSLLMQNPYCDYSAAMDDFLSAYYGEKAAPYIRAYIDMTIENAAKQHVGIYADMDATFSFTDEEIQKIDELWASAVACYDGQDDDGAIYLARIERSEISWVYWKADCNKGEFAGLNKYAARLELINRLNAAGTVMMGEGKTSGTISKIMCIFPPSHWQQAGVLYYYVAVFFVYGLLIIMALVVTIIGICKKDVYAIITLPWMIGTFALLMWSLTVFIEWASMALYALTCVLTAAAVGYFAFVWYRAKHPDRPLGKAIHTAGINGLISGGVLQTGVVYLFNNIIFHLAGNQKAYCVVLLMQGVYILFFLLGTIIAFIKRKKKN